MRKSSALVDKERVVNGRGWAFAFTVLFHVGLVGLLLSHIQTQPRHPMTAQRPIVFLQLPSAILQAEQPAAQPQKAAPKPQHKRPKPVVTPKPSPVPVPVPVQTTAVATRAASEASSPTPAAAPPMDADPGVPPPTAYLMRITRIINLEQKYPWSARQYDQQGDVIVRMHLARDGRVISVQLIHSSGYASLDDEARDVILRIARFPPFPFDYLPRIAEFDIDQPITFRHYLN